MVTNATSFSGRGLRDWLLQRVSALVIAAYAAFIISYLLTHPLVQYEQWLALFQQVWLRVFTVVALLAVLVHTWIGLWTVLTDYVRQACLRIVLLSLLVLLLLSYVVWCLQILWGV